MSEPMSADERARLRAEHEHPTRPDWCDTIRLLDEVDRLTEALEAAEGKATRWKQGWDEDFARAERAEADLAQSESTLAGLRRVHAETVERYQRAEADLADEKRRHGEATEDRDMFRERYYAEVKQHLARLSDGATGDARQ